MKREYSAEECQRLIDEKLDLPFFRAIVDPVRSSLVLFLATHGEMTIGEIAEQFPQNRSVISRHLDLLNRYGVVIRRKQGREVYYRADPKVVANKLQEAATNMTGLMSLSD
ncbi:metalloregulator ArsR/SmtB family transcription factor [Lacticaseibacillus pabuli]|uniref:Metalloregulator ArsR/SmtB family transcription factor n=1 Tax=Lacticaseibacillus pabuli TaxID=3025672 RepID=A0ABY7WUS5_9LACO|nr:metalloregulator ArsR/SmtB family transcription factor [Lacticaseibacillus sp. KACC 23028]WDF83228.1 metalloregulator ArsR/SmtB family transcription factor [Lacticaseibacillus sp. KACC 23028]